MSEVTKNHPIVWYRSSLFSAAMVAITAFTCPGMFGSLNGMGAGGGASDNISNAANAIVFGVLSVGSLVVGGICNRISPRYTVMIGTIGYAPYAAGLYVVDQYGHTWLLLFGSVILGISACFLWVGSGAIFMGYTEENRKGTATSLKFATQYLGASLGGIISLGLNANRSYRGSVSRATYIVFMTIMCLGLPFAWLITPADKVQRTDGRKVDVRTTSTSLLQEYKVLAKLLRKPAVWSLIPLMVYAQWFLSYQWQFNYAYFTVRSRALNSLLFYLSGSLAAILLGALLDWEGRFRRQTRARLGCAIVVVITGASWILGQIVQVHYSHVHLTLDYANKNFGLGCATFFLWGLSDHLVTVQLYWLVGTLTNRLQEATFLSALINATGSVGTTFGFVVSAMSFNYNGACALNLALFFISVPGLVWVSFTQVTDTAHGFSLAETDGQTGDATGSQITKAPIVVNSEKVAQ